MPGMSRVFIEDERGPENRNLFHAAESSADYLLRTPRQ
jgi:hypothetical protein